MESLFVAEATAIGRCANQDLLEKLLLRLRLAVSADEGCGDPEVRAAHRALADQVEDRLVALAVARRPRPAPAAAGSRARALGTVRLLPGLERALTGRGLAEHRRELGLTQVAFAAHIGVSQATVSKAEARGREPLSGVVRARFHALLSARARPA